MVPGIEQAQLSHLLVVANGNISDLHIPGEEGRELRRNPSPRISEGGI